MRKICKIAGCENRAGTGRGMCHKHYGRWRAHGHTELTTGAGPTDPWERFALKTRRVVGGCLEWTGYVGNSGYGQTTLNNRYRSAHRFSWELHNGPIPKGMCVCHKCDNKLCLEPTHLFLGTFKDNTQDMLRKGRGLRRISQPGENNIKTKLTWDDVNYARTVKAPAKLVAKALGVHPSTIYNIRRGESWRISP